MDNLEQGLNSIKESLSILASDFDLQESFLKEFFASDAVAVDELALQFRDDFVFLFPQIDNEPKFTQLCTFLSALDRRLDHISGPDQAGLWSLEGLQMAPVWEEIRLLARECLAHMP